MDELSANLYRQQVEAASTSRQAELVQMAKTLYQGLAPLELWRHKFKDGEDWKLFQILQSGRYRVVDFDDGCVLIEGCLAELTGEVHKHDK